jgi:hypothetical protein
MKSPLKMILATENAPVFLPEKANGVKSQLLVDGIEFALLLLLNASKDFASSIILFPKFFLSF